MLLSRCNDLGPHSDISVKQIYEGFAIANDGRVKVCFLLWVASLLCDGRD